MPDFIDIDGAPAAAFGLSDDHAAGRQTGVHSHARHQLLYCSAGALRLHVEGALYLLPPARAAWLPGGTPHDVGSQRGAALRTVYLDPRFKGPPAPQVFPMPPLGGQLVRRAMQFPADEALDEFGVAFFTTLAGLVHEWARDAMTIRLPNPTSPEATVAIALILERLAEPLALADVAASAGVHPRTMRRRLARDGTSFRELLRDARILRAMEQLSDPGLRITDVGFDVGYETPSAFAHAFKEVTGESPRAFRARLAARDAGV